MVEKHQRSDNKSKLNKDDYNWGRLRGITNDKLEKTWQFFKMLCP